MASLAPSGQFTFRWREAQDEVGKGYEFAGSHCKSHALPHTSSVSLRSTASPQGEALVRCKHKSVQLHDLVVQIRVPSVLGQQFFVGAALDDAALLQNHDGVGFADRGEAVGDDEGGAVLHDGVHALFDVPLGPGVHGAGGLIQDQDRGLGDGGPGDVQKLPLALTQIGGVLLQHGVVAVLETHDEGVGRGHLGGLLHLFVGGVQAAVADVLPDGAGEQVGVLEDHGDVLPEEVPGNPLDGHAVDGDGAALDIVEPGQKIGHRGLTRAGGADEGDLLAGLGVEGDVVEDRAVRRVAEGSPL